MTTNTSLTVNRIDYSKTEVVKQDLPSVKAGQVLLKVSEFSLTANNVTYAAMGDFLKYWEFFPSPEDTGIIPVWGFAEVVSSECDGVAVGERFYGYYPMATYLVVEPIQVNAASFIDGAEHRQPLSVIYNQYIRCSNDPIYQQETEALQMLLRPLFTTSFLLDDFFADNDMFGSEQMILTSASSKTALGMAFLLHHNRQGRSENYQIIGLTSDSNKDFVEALGCYDKVVSYDELAQLDGSLKTSIVDFAGNGQLLAQLHEHFAQTLQYSCKVGASHWDQLGGAPAKLAGPEPIMFFAPSQAEKRIKEWGGVLFQQKIADVWLAFTGFVDGWIDVEHHNGVQATNDIYQKVLSGNFNPKAGYIVSLWDK
jgi:Protein of unknown function (DUF2855)